MHVLTIIAVLAGFGLANPIPAHALEILNLRDEFPEEDEGSLSKPLLDRNQIENLCMDSALWEPEFKDKKSCLANLSCWVSLYKIEEDKAKKSGAEQEMVKDRQLQACTAFLLRTKVFD
ncbi:hypothetical protein XA68_17210 [Ophiocordyceps unilateralis]|uniref:Uncharacterized protein n=1 Tax=Ophiocordyceps unilateralis TaxID=268505 RepID=A0A2A9PJ16_OPHUN|nr:hypothetical protein XA68_17210 [Ophiocordyceps unilateralis]